MGKKIKLHPAAIKYIKDIAAMLPVIPSGNGQIFYLQKGSVAISQGKSADKEGNGFKPNQTYVGSKGEPMPTNHFKRLKKIYAESGEDGIQSYVDKVKGDYIKSVETKINKKSKDNAGL